MAFKYTKQECESAETQLQMALIRPGTLSEKNFSELVSLYRSWWHTHGRFNTPKNKNRDILQRLFIKAFESRVDAKDDISVLLQFLHVNDNHLLTIYECPGFNEDEQKQYLRYILRQATLGNFSVYGASISEINIQDLTPCEYALHKRNPVLLDFVIRSGVMAKENSRSMSKLFKIVIEPIILMNPCFMKPNRLQLKEREREKYRDAVKCVLQLLEISGRIEPYVVLQDIVNRDKVPYTINCIDSKVAPGFQVRCMSPSPMLHDIYPHIHKSWKVPGNVSPLLFTRRNRFTYFEI